jgi:GNAT superfamily N-acetyltransferase
MYRYHTLDQPAAMLYAPLLQAEDRPLLDKLAPTAASTPPDGSEVVAVGAAFLGKPRGLALAAYHHETHTAYVLDLVVAKPYRKLGVGTHLLQHLETSLHSQGCERLFVSYRKDDHTPALERVLHKTGWQPPQTDRLLFWASKAIIEAPWMNLPLPSGYSFFPWEELTPSEQEALAQRHATQTGGWWTEGLSPFSYPLETLDTTTSLGLRRGNEVVGWMLNRPLAAGILEYSILFVSQPLQRRGYGIRLLAESIKRQYAEYGEEGGGGVSPNNVVMVRFVERRMGQWLIDRSEQRHAKKALTAP